MPLRRPPTSSPMTSPTGPSQRELHLLALGHVLVERVAAALDREPRARGAARGHAAVDLVEAAAPAHDVARALAAPGQQAADHHGARTRGDRLGEIARPADAAVGDQRDARIARGARALQHGRELRHSDAGDEARRAREARPDADLDGVGARGGEIAHALGGGDVAGDDLGLGEAPLELAHRVERRVGVAVGDVEHERVGVGCEQRLGALEIAAAHADRRRHAQPALGVARGMREARLLLEVAQRDHAGHAAVGVGQRQLLDAVLVHQRQRVGGRDPGLARDEVVERRHLLGDGVRVGARAQVARGQDAGQSPVGIHDEQAGDAEALGLGARLARGSRPARSCAGRRSRACGSA